MTDKPRWFQTTAIDYPNSRPHIGTAFEKLGADVQARYRRMEGHRVFFLMGNDENTVKVAKRAAEASNAAQDYDRLGLAWALLGRAPEAIAAFSAAVQRDPNSAPIRLNFAVSLANGGRPDLARREAEEALMLDPNYARAKQFLASLK